MSEHDKLIRIISYMGDRYGSELIKFMDQYGLTRLSDSTCEELYKYITDKIKHDYN